MYRSHQVIAVQDLPGGADAILSARPGQKTVLWVRDSLSDLMLGILDEAVTAEQQRESTPHPQIA